MSLYALKPRFQSLLRPTVPALHTAGVTANQVTIAACLVSVLLGAWLASHAGDLAWFLLLPAWFVVRMAFNAIDGMLARAFGQSTPLGRTSLERCASLFPLCRFRYVLRSSGESGLLDSRMRGNDEDLSPIADTAGTRCEGDPA